MTLPPPSNAADVVLPDAWDGDMQASSVLFSVDGLDLHLIQGSQFAPVADAVGILREATYRQQLSGSGDQRDLDGRDPAYDHLLLIERDSGVLAGAARLQFIPQGTDAADLPGSDQSYLEHVYPGIKADLARRENHLEIGRVALAARFQRQPASLMALFRGGLLIAARSGYATLHGLVSYNHFAYDDAVNSRFLSALMRPPYRRLEPVLPAPRHPLDSINPSTTPHPVDNIQALEVQLRQEIDDSFRLPVLLRQYFNLMEAKVCDLSLARDFNQITEILMAADLNNIPAERLTYFVDLDHQPIYQRFSWYRGDQ